MRFTKKLAIAAAGLPLAANPVVVDAADAAPARVFLKDGSPGEIGGSATIVGTNAAEDITLRDEPGQIEFDASFNRGNDTIRLPGKASGYSVRQVGSQALLTQDTRSYSIPVGMAGTAIVFTDGARTLSFRAPGNAMFLGSQRISNKSTPLS